MRLGDKLLHSVKVVVDLNRFNSEGVVEDVWC